MGQSIQGTELEKEEPRETVGAASLRLLENPDEKQGVIETREEIMKKYIANLEECALRYPDWTDPFYVIVLNRRDRLMVNVVRQIFFGRRTLPRSDYDQAVYHYDPKTGHLRFIWVVPDKETVEELAFSPIDIETPELQRLCHLFVHEKLNEQFAENRLKQPEKLQVTAS